MQEGAGRTLRYAGCILLACVAALLVAVPVLGQAEPEFEETASAVTMVGAGDIADCGITRDRATAKLVGRIKGTVFTLGDNVYDRGTAREFARCYDPTWGRYKKRTRPSPGNHEYYTNGAKPYYRYFGWRAGRPSRGYYSYDRGNWHIVVLNSNCEKVGGCGPGSRQLEWLRSNLANNPARCTLAYFHHPLFSSGRGAETRKVKPFWRALYNSGADIILSGHAHSYERFAPQTPDGRKSLKRGIRQFVVGTGGKPPIKPFGARPRNSVVRNDKTPGVLKLTLKRGSYDWRFLHIPGKSFTDSGTDRCH